MTSIQGIACSKRREMQFCVCAINAIVDIYIPLSKMSISVLVNQKNFPHSITTVSYSNQRQCSNPTSYITLSKISIPNSEHQNLYLFNETAISHSTSLCLLSSSQTPFQNIPQNSLRPQHSKLLAHKTIRAARQYCKVITHFFRHRTQSTNDYRNYNAFHLPHLPQLSTQWLVLSQLL